MSIFPDRIVRTERIRITLRFASLSAACASAIVQCCRACTSHVIEDLDAICRLLAAARDVINEGLGGRKENM